jgi:dUTP pyrophosphatase
MATKGKVPVRVVAQPGAELPVYASNDAAGADLCAFLPDGPLTIAGGGGRAVIPTGLVVEIPTGYEGQVRPRSGLAARHGITVLNSPGTIDSDYRGELRIILINHGTESFTISHGNRIAQLVIAPVITCEFLSATTTESTERGERGFGSTGV